MKKDDSEITEYIQSVPKKKAKLQAKIMFAPTTSKKSTETLSDTTPNISSSFQNKDSATTEPVSSMYANISDSFENEAASVSQIAKKSQKKCSVI